MRWRAKKKKKKRKDIKTFACPERISIHFKLGLLIKSKKSQLNFSIRHVKVIRPFLLWKTHVRIEILSN